jgi:CubicO group peptidase (beta-lactamase class C family)
MGKERTLMNAMAIPPTQAAQFALRILRVQIWTAVGFLLLAAGSGIAKAAPQSGDGISRLTKPLILDGKMGDPGWKLATRYTDFKMRHPEAGLPPSEQTEVFLAYDAATLYVAIRSSDDEPKKIRALATTGGDAWKDDWAVLCLNPYDDALSSLFFLVTPRNVRSSGVLDNDNKPQLTVDMKWESRASIVADGWIAEMAIPLRSLAHEGGSRVIMSFKVARFISRKGEEENLPEMQPDQREYDHYREIVLRDVVHSPATASEVYRQGLENLRRKRMQMHDLAYEEQLHRWGDASVLDYLTFRSRDLTASRRPFHFQRNPEDQKVAALLESMEYAPGKRVGNLERFLTRSATTSFLVVKDDTLVYEHYFNGYQRDSVVTSFSMAKSFDSTLVGIAIDDGKIGSVQDPITKYLPELAKRDPRFAQITIRDLLMMSAGLRYDEKAPYHDNDVTYHAPDLRRAALEKTTIVDTPGKYWLYNNYHPLLLGLVLERVTGMSVTAYLQDKLWGPLGMEYPASWSINGDQNGLEKMESGINARPIDFAKFGRLMLNHGQWEGKQIVSPAWVEQATQPEEKPASYYRDEPFFVSQGHYYKYFWWGDKRPEGESDFHAVGNKGQYIYVSPQKQVIIFRNGFDFGIPSSRWARLFYQLADGL